MTMWTLAMLALGILGTWIAPRLDGVTGTDVRDWAPVVSAFVAAIGVLMGGFTYAASSRRQRRELTLRAWGEWSDSVRDVRRQLRAWAGSRLNDEIAQEMVRLASVPLASIQDAPQKTMAKRAQQLNDVLNRLDRLATGWDDGLYDLDILERAGATAIVNTYRRYTPYIRAVRGHGQPTAFEATQRLTEELVKRRSDLRE